MHNTVFHAVSEIQLALMITFAEIKNSALTYRNYNHHKKKPYLTGQASLNYYWQTVQFLPTAADFFFFPCSIFFSLRLCLIISHFCLCFSRLLDAGTGATPAAASAALSLAA